MKTAVTASEFHKKLVAKKKPIILDIRTQAEYEDFNFGGHHFPFDELMADINKIDFLKSKPAIIICYTGLQSEIARKILLKRGFDKLQNLEGGIEAYLALEF